MSASDIAYKIIKVEGDRIDGLVVPRGDSCEITGQNCRVTGEISVEAGGRLVISDSTLSFDGNAGIFSMGVVSFSRSAFKAATPSDGWRNIIVRGEGAGNSFISECSFENARGGSADMTCRGGGSTISGGALLFLETADRPVSVTGTKFEKCEARDNGGAICCNGSNVTIDSCVFNECSAIDPHSTGGAICCRNSAPRITGCEFTGCSSGSGNFGVGGGGAINCTGASPYIENCSFSECHSFGHGGAISCNDKSSPTIECCTFTSCRTGAKHAVGGAIFFDYHSNAKVFNSAFDRCSAQVRGGAICLSNKCSVIIENCKFENCSCASKEYGVGGAFYIYNSTAAIKRSVFKTCSTNGRGGAVYCDYHSTTDIENCEFTGCTCKDFGGAIYYDIDCPTKITAPAFDKCKPNSVNHESHAENRMPQNAIKVKSSSGQCFIATAAYGSALEPEVEALRDYRDRVLLKTAPGRVFVKTYYAVSPPIARIVEKSGTLRAIVRAALAPIVRLVR